MREYLVTVLLAAIITYLITPFVRDLAIKSGAVLPLFPLKQVSDDDIDLIFSKAKSWHTAV